MSFKRLGKGSAFGLRQNQNHIRTTSTPVTQTDPQGDGEFRGSASPAWMGVSQGTASSAVQTAPLSFLLLLSIPCFM